ncbi:MAG: pentapeptide repeat-containing protein [Candidatus Dormibacteraeota bacterium]|nr:pentapeptide repeat-containing protein [Candidatus Dormibacteraeota bacterium]
MSDAPSMLRPPSDVFMRALDAHHRWAQPGQYPSAPGQEPSAELFAKGLDLSRTDFSAADLADVWWIECVVDNSRFADAYMPGFRAYDTSWVACDFARAQLAKSEATRCNYAGASFRAAYLVRLELTECDLRETDLSGADLGFFTAAHSDIRDATIHDTVLDGVSFDDSHVAGMNLAGCSGTILGPGSKGHPRINVGTPEDPEWLVADDALAWLRSRGAPTLAFFGEPSP